MRIPFDEPALVRQWVKEYDSGSSAPSSIEPLPLNTVRVKIQVSLYIGTDVNIHADRTGPGACLCTVTLVLVLPYVCVACLLLDRFCGAGPSGLIDILILILMPVLWPTRRITRSTIVARITRYRHCGTNTLCLCHRVVIKHHVDVWKRVIHTARAPRGTCRISGGLSPEPEEPIKSGGVGSGQRRRSINLLVCPLIPAILSMEQIR